MNCRVWHEFGYLRAELLKSTDFFIANATYCYLDSIVFDDEVNERKHGGLCWSFEFYIHWFFLGKLWRFLIKLVSFLHYFSRENQLQNQVRYTLWTWVAASNRSQKLSPWFHKSFRDLHRDVRQELYPWFHRHPFQTYRNTN